MWHKRGEEGEPGVWIGALSSEEAESTTYGIWPIGDKRPADEPGFTPKLMYKSWVGDPKKYGKSGHRVSAGAHGGKREFVMTMAGCLRCDCEDQCHSLSYPASIELPSDVARTWVLPDGAGYTRGITICRDNDKASAYIPGDGLEYELHLFEVEFGAKLPSFLLAPERLAQWSWQYIEVFSGQLKLSFHGSEHSAPLLNDYSHAFIPSVIPPYQKNWNNLIRDYHVRGVCIYY